MATCNYTINSFKSQATRGTQKGTIKMNVNSELIKHMKEKLENYRGVSVEYSISNGQLAYLNIDKNIFNKENEVEILSYLKNFSRSITNDEDVVYDDIISLSDFTNKNDDSNDIAKYDIRYNKLTDLIASQIYATTRSTDVISADGKIISFSIIANRNSVTMSTNITHVNKFENTALDEDSKLVRTSIGILTRLSNKLNKLRTKENTKQITETLKLISNITLNEETSLKRVNNILLGIKHKTKKNDDFSTVNDDELSDAEKNTLIEELLSGILDDLNSTIARLSNLSEGNNNIGELTSLLNAVYDNFSILISRYANVNNNIKERLHSTMESIKLLNQNYVAKKLFNNINFRNIYTDLLEYTSKLADNYSLANRIQQYIESKFGEGTSKTPMNYFDANIFRMLIDYISTTITDNKQKNGQYEYDVSKLIYALNQMLFSSKDPIFDGLSSMGSSLSGSHNIIEDVLMKDHYGKLQEINRTIKEFVEVIKTIFNDNGITNPDIFLAKTNKKRTFRLISRYNDTIQRELGRIALMQERIIEQIKIGNTDNRDSITIMEEIRHAHNIQSIPSNISLMIFRYFISSKDISMFPRAASSITNAIPNASFEDIRDAFNERQKSLNLPEMSDNHIREIIKSQERLIDKYIEMANTSTIEVENDSGSHSNITNAFLPGNIFNASFYNSNEVNKEFKAIENDEIKYKVLLDLRDTLYQLREQLPNSVKKNVHPEELLTVDSKKKSYIVKKQFFNNTLGAYMANIINIPSMYIINYYNALFNYELSANAKASFRDRNAVSTAEITTIRQEAKKEASDWLRKMDYSIKKIDKHFDTNHGEMLAFAIGKTNDASNKGNIAFIKELLSLAGVSDDDIANKFDEKKEELLAQYKELTVYETVIELIMNDISVSNGVSLIDLLDNYADVIADYQKKDAMLEEVKAFTLFTESMVSEFKQDNNRAEQQKNAYEGMTNTLKAWLKHSFLNGRSDALKNDVYSIIKSITGVEINDNNIDEFAVYLADLAYSNNPVRAIAIKSKNYLVYKKDERKIIRAFNKKIKEMINSLPDSNDRELAINDPIAYINNKIQKGISLTSTEIAIFEMANLISEFTKVVSLNTIITTFKGLTVSAKLMSNFGSMFANRAGGIHMDAMTRAMGDYEDINKEANKIATAVTLNKLGIMSFLSKKKKATARKYSNVINKMGLINDIRREHSDNTGANINASTELSDVHINLTSIETYNQSKTIVSYLLNNKVFVKAKNGNFKAHLYNIIGYKSRLDDKLIESKDELNSILNDKFNGKVKIDNNNIIRFYDKKGNEITLNGKEPNLGNIINVDEMFTMSYNLKKKIKDILLKNGFTIEEIKSLENKSLFDTKLKNNFVHVRLSDLIDENGDLANNYITETEKNKIEAQKRTFGLPEDEFTNHLTAMLNARDDAHGEAYNREKSVGSYRKNNLVADMLLFTTTLMKKWLFSNLKFYWKPPSYDHVTGEITHNANYVDTMTLAVNSILTSLPIIILAGLNPASIVSIFLMVSAPLLYRKILADRKTVPNVLSELKSLNRDANRMILSTYGSLKYIMLDMANLGLLGFSSSLRVLRDNSFESLEKLSDGDAQAVRNIVGNLKGLSKSTAMILESKILYTIVAYAIAKSTKGLGTDDDDRDKSTYEKTLLAISNVLNVYISELEMFRNPVKLVTNFFFNEGRYGESALLKMAKRSFKDSKYIERDNSKVSKVVTDYTLGYFGSHLMQHLLYDKPVTPLFNYSYEGFGDEIPHDFYSRMSNTLLNETYIFRQVEEMYRHHTSNFMDVNKIAAEFAGQILNTPLKKEVIESEIISGLNGIQKHVYRDTYDMYSKLNTSFIAEISVDKDIKNIHENKYAEIYSGIKSFTDKMYKIKPELGVLSMMVLTKEGAIKNRINDLKFTLDINENRMNNDNLEDMLIKEGASSNYRQSFYNALETPSGAKLINELSNALVGYTNSSVTNMRELYSTIMKNRGDNPLVKTISVDYNTATAKDMEAIIKIAHHEGLITQQEYESAIEALSNQKEALDESLMKVKKNNP